MQHRTATVQPTAGDLLSPAPPDIQTMRDSARRAMNFEGNDLKLDTLIALLQGHVRLLVPEIRALVQTAPAGDQTALIAQVGVDEAWRRVNTTAFGADALNRQARKLAMSTLSLCDHWENLTSPSV
ncbi:DUF6415 family natural product biosynthesis protein [Streptomyces zhihengii]